MLVGICVYPTRPGFHQDLRIWHPHGQTAGSTQLAQTEEPLLACPRRPPFREMGLSADNQGVDHEECCPAPTPPFVDASMADPAEQKMSLIERLDTEQNEVMSALDDLNTRVEEVIRAWMRPADEAPRRNEAA